MSKRIMHLIGQLARGGAERQMISVCIELKRHGWNQVVTTFCPGAVWDRKIIEAGIALLPLPRHPVPMCRLWYLHQLVRREAPQLIHSWSLHTNVYASYLPFKKSLLVLSFRSNPTVDGVVGTPTGKVSHAWIYDCADWVVSNSRRALADARSAGICPKRESVVGNIVNIPESKPKASGKAIRIVAAGSLNPLKGYHDLLNALGILARNGEPFELALAGDGPERKRLEELASRLNIRSHVAFLGEIEDVPALMASADLLVHPSYSEGLSNSILEGMAAGLPVVATPVGATPEYVEDYKTGFLVSSGQPALLAEKMSLLAKQPELRLQLGQAALSRVRELCGAQQITRQYEQVYNSLLGRV
ncbi:MAG: glycosyltransferase [Acidobacteria bacterium]|nr:glycosyltransferase [Acidobacteriota bacterium]